MYNMQNVSSEINFLGYILERTFWNDTRLDGGIWSFYAFDGDVGRNTLE